jgi:hypothetical protein
MRGSALVVGVLVLLASACSTEDPATREPLADATLTPAQAPVLGASHALLPMPGGDGLVLLTGPPEGAPSVDPLGVWQWDGTAWQEHAGSGPVARNYFSAAYDEGRDVVVLYGGDAGADEATTVWEWDGAGWSASPPAGLGPRLAAAMAYDASAEEVVLYGGDSAGTVKGDTWTWDGSRWARAAVRGPEPARWPAAFAGTSEGVLLVAGHQVGDEDFGPAVDDTWVWDGRWRAVPEAGGPGLLVNAGTVEHATLGTLLVGGSDLDRATGDVWRWADERWELVAEGVFPERQAFGIGYDAERDVVVMTGGVVSPGSTERHQDVWEWSGDPAEPAVLVLDAGVSGGS